MSKSVRTRSTRLVSRPSPYHSSVTLFEPGVSGVRNASTRSRRKEAAEIVDVEDVVPSLEPSPSKSKGKSVARKQKSIPTALDKPHPAPENWREVYDTIKEMRSRIVAPVDTMGCDQAQFKETDPKNRRFATLVSLMLSSQTKDEVTDAAVSKLRDALGGSLSVPSMVEADETAISSAISKVGFWRRKTGYLKQTALRLRDDFDSDVPKTVDELCSLPGVGPKMAFLALQVAWNLNLGIGVDVHVHRITNRLGWHKPSTKTPEETRLNLQSWLPIELHPEINHLLVGFGQTICLPTGPRCGSCILSENKLCPSAKKSGVSTSKKTRSPKVEIEIEDPDSCEMGN
ncbi:DNA glycosylase, partial [Amanita rubescens]